MTTKPMKTTTPKEAASRALWAAIEADEFDNTEHALDSFESDMITRWNHLGFDFIEDARHEFWKLAARECSSPQEDLR